MLKKLTSPPTNLAKQPEVTNDSNALDRATLGEKGDLRTYASADGKQKFLRVWLSPASSVQQPGEETASWFEIVKSPAQEPEPHKSK